MWWVLAGCANKRIVELEAQIAAMTERVEAAERRSTSGGTAIDQDAEREAAELLKEAHGLFEKMDFDGTRGKLDELAEKYPGTRANRASKRILDELAVIGEDAGELAVAMWYQGEADMNDGKATLLVFWEVWCPHCKREVPKIDATYTRYKDQGLNLIGLTKQTRDVTEEQVRAFIDANHVSYPIAREAGEAMSSRFNVKGVPAAAVVKDGTIVWRGHPARITDAMIDGWLEVGR